ncbi:MAG: hypothetical protein HSCHL_0600 [Hydrogenibacillus schlegelii]|uniref:Uncharacterized protein n=1 Tax=Hydrogenibacillus schlegelii TaxID=1484 RepID=A0A2T5GDP9_HYDSH|nr:MAG: hypothetical protein HSCHL_0600 [Hydrogenibacillus schlegelii]
MGWGEATNGLIAGAPGASIVAALDPTPGKETDRCGATRRF